VTGSIVEYPIPTVNSSPIGITIGSDGQLWFTEMENNIGKISPKDGAITEYRIVTVDFPQHIIQIHTPG
jgi:virginiamycin B lyase